MRFELTRPTSHVHENMGGVTVNENRNRLNCLSAIALCFLQLIIRSPPLVKLLANELLFGLIVASVHHKTGHYFSLSGHYSRAIDEFVYL